MTPCQIHGEDNDSEPSEDEDADRRKKKVGAIVKTLEAYILRLPF